MPPVSGSVRTSGWRQGSFVGCRDHRALLDESVDRVPEPVATPFRLVVVTQDCDLVRQPDIEPWVELVLCSEVATVEPLYRNGRNPRLLRVRPICPQEPAAWLEISIHDRFRIAKEKPVGLNPDKTARRADERHEEAMAAHADAMAAHKVQAEADRQRHIEAMAALDTHRQRSTYGARRSRP